MAANLTSLAFKFAESFKSKPRPELDIVLKQHGGGDGLHFGAKISEVSNRVPAIRVHVFAELEEEGVVWEIDQPVNLRAGEIDREVRSRSSGRSTGLSCRSAITSQRSTAEPSP